jgi:biopolymer transport protein ExbD
MRRPRRQSWDIRFELAPMLDVVFILLTFFIFAMVLSKRFTVTDIRLPRTGPASQTPAPEQGESIVVSLKPGGGLALNNQPTTLETLADELAKLQRDTPSAKVYLAPDTAASSGELFQLMDALAKAGIRDLRFLRKAEERQTRP